MAGTSALTANWRIPTHRHVHPQVLLPPTLNGDEVLYSAQADQATYQRQMCAPATVKIVGRRERWRLWHVSIRVVVEKPGGGVVVDERVVDEPVDRAALGAGLVKGVPRWQ